MTQPSSCSAVSRKYGCMGIKMIEVPNNFLFTAQIDAIAFFPPHEVDSAMAEPRAQIPLGLYNQLLTELIEYFAENYLAANSRLPPRTWNVHEATLGGDCRTNNLCESWNSSFKTLVGEDNPSLWKLLMAMKRDEVTVSK